MRTQAFQDVVRGQICFWLFTALCVSLHPGFVLKANEGGMSDYGIHIKTAIPYTLALGLTATFSLRAAGHIGRDSRAGALAWVLRGYGWLLLAVLASTFPYSLDLALRDIHFSIGTSLAVVEALGSIWMYRVARVGRADALCLVTQAIGLVLLLLTGVGRFHLLFAAQMVIATGFGSLLVRSTLHLSAVGSRPTREPSAHQMSLRILRRFR